MAIFIKYGALNGEVDVVGYEKWMMVDSLQFGCGRGIAAPVGGSSKREATAPSISEIVITKTMDAISPLMLKEALAGEAKEVKIELTQTDGGAKHVAYQKYILTGTVVSGYSVSSGGDRPSESISLNFSKIDSEYLKIDDKFKSVTTGHVVYDIGKQTMV